MSVEGEPTGTPGDQLRSMFADGGHSLGHLLAHVGTVHPSAPDDPQEVVDQIAELTEPLRDDVGDTDDLMRAVHGKFGFRGNPGNYYDVRNSLLHEVLARRTGIPLALGVIVHEVGRILDVPVHLIGLPGHVVVAPEVQDPESPVWFDPFAGGRRLDRQSVIDITQQFRPGEEFSDAELQPMTPTNVVARTLENLRIAAVRSGEVSLVPAVLELRLAIPGAPLRFRGEYANALAALGRYDLAAAEREALAALEPDNADKHEALAARYRSHRN